MASIFERDQAAPCSSREFWGAPAGETKEAARQNEFQGCLLPWGHSNGPRNKTQEAHGGLCEEFARVPQGVGTKPVEPFSTVCKVDKPSMTPA